LVLTTGEFNSLVFDGLGSCSSQYRGVRLVLYWNQQDGWMDALEKE